MAAHQHHGADRIHKTSQLKTTCDMNITPMIDVLLVLLVILRYGDIINVLDAAKGAGVERVGIVTEGMRSAAGATSGL
jgi:biopolymer transport protein ExbD